VGFQVGAVPRATSGRRFPGEAATAPGHDEEDHNPRQHEGQQKDEEHDAGQMGLFGAVERGGVIEQSHVLLVRLPGRSTQPQIPGSAKGHPGIRHARLRSDSRFYS
jgi:hypothetical protein